MSISSDKLRWRFPLDVGGVYIKCGWGLWGLDQ